MQQFALLIISLCIAIIICAFSVVNGFNEQIKSKILSETAPIIIIPKIENKDNFLAAAQIYNVGFELPKISDPKISHIEYIRNMYTSVRIKNDIFKVNVYEKTEQIVPIVINPALNNAFNERDATEIIIADPAAFNSLSGDSTRFKRFKEFLVDDNISEAGFIIYLSSAEYKKILHNKNYNKINIFVKNVDSAQVIAEKITEQLKTPNLSIKSWQDLHQDLLGTINIQKKIFLLIYSILFTLLCAIIISTSIAFFKEKRKDWALLKILNVIPYSVEKIFLYKNIITFLISSITGLILGYVLTIYSNEIIELITKLMDSKINTKTIFIVDKITYQFQLNDFITIFSFVFIVFAINFFVLLKVFHKENISNILKGD